MVFPFCSEREAPGERGTLQRKSTYPTTLDNVGLFFKTIFKSQSDLCGQGMRVDLRRAGERELNVIRMCCMKLKTLKE